MFANRSLACLALLAVIAPACKKTSREGAPEWRRYVNTKFRFAVVAPPLRQEIEVPPDTDPSLTGSAFQFEFHDEQGFGHVTALDIQGIDDLEQGLDSAIESAVAGLAGKFSRSDKRTVDGLSVREFEFEGRAKYRNIRGIGRGYAIAPTSIRIVIGAYEAKGPASAYNRARRFLNSFEILTGPEASSPP